MKKNIKIKILFAFCLFIFTFLLAGECFALTCAEKYPGDGKCMPKCTGIAGDYTTELCPTGQSCCHKYAAPATYTLQVPIFGYVQVSGIDQYIINIYQYAIPVIVILAVIIIMMGGIMWMLAAGNISKIKRAKEFISGAIIGVIIALLSAQILALVGISSIKPLQVEVVSEIEAPDTNAPLSDTALTTPPPAQLFCPKSGGIANLGKVAQSTIGKITYRFGGKGGLPPYPSDTKICNSQPCRDFCPAGTLCLDCSGYINYILMCSGLSRYGGGTQSIFGCNCSSSEKITSCGNNSINGKALKPGDVLGYPTGCGFNTGHVYIYAGNNILYESSGGTSGRQSGKSVRTTQLCGHNWTGMGKPTCIKRL
ncbi:C40 family peptidase [Candidatus Falkowbacteria bacterium]|nr:C40 family peptidase [Candidatus Falkowbacteria bacterium]